MEVVTGLLFVARKCITKPWVAQDPPSIAKWLAGIKTAMRNSHINMEGVGRNLCKFCHAGWENII